MFIKKNYFSPHCSDKTLSNIKNEMSTNIIWIAENKTKDIKGRYVANVLVGISMLNYPIPSFLLTCKTLEKKTEKISIYCGSIC